MKYPYNINNRSQDLDKIYHDSGQFYFARTKAFIAENSLFCKRTVPMILSELEVQDIDNEIDWKLAELKYQLMTDSYSP
jgi:N-acylneuraminate cytidylyltransferase